jgi:uncharacterized protein (TIGR03437 family)
VTAQGGFEAGSAIPNVGVRIPPLGGKFYAYCNGPSGVVLTNAQGVATCDLILGSQPVSTQITALVGEFQNTPSILLTVTPATACSYSLSPTGQSFGYSGGSASVTVTAGAACSWTAVSNASWLAITSSPSGSGNGTVTFGVAANSGAARNGTLTIGGQTFTVQQAAVNTIPNPLSITTSGNLPAAAIGSFYSATLSATGGTPSYSWSSSTLPNGLSLNSSTGLLSGVPTAPGNYSFTATVKDSAGASQTQNFSLTVLSNSGGLAITTTAFPAGFVGQAYMQTLTSSGGCSTPFSPSPAFHLVSGTLPPGLFLSSDANNIYSIGGTPTATGAYGFTLSATDACGSTASASFSITIQSSGTGPTISASPSSLTFAVQLGNTTSVLSQSITLSTTGASLPYTASAATTNGVNFLNLSGTSGSIPGVLTVSLVNYAQLGAGTYSGTVTINAAASNNPLTIPVTLTVTSSPVISVNPSNLQVTLPSIGNTSTQQAIVVNSALPITFTAGTSTNTGAGWLSVSPNSGTTPATVVVIINAGGLAAGAYTGTVTIASAGSSPQTVAVTLTVLSSATLTPSPGALSFTYIPGGAQPAPELFNVASSAAATTVTATAGTASGGSWLSVSPGSLSTPGAFTVFANPATLATGTYVGSITLQPSNASIPATSVPVTLTVGPQPPLVVSVTNAASSVPGPVAPGEIITLFGSAMGPTNPAEFTLTALGVLPTNLGGTRVLFDGTAAPLIYSSAGQVSAIAPYELAGRGSTVLQLEYDSVLSYPITLRVVDTSPGVFTLDSSGQGAIVNQDGTVNGAQNGAPAGSIVSIYATGEGATIPTGVDGQIITGPNLPLPAAQVSVQINAENVSILYAGEAPGEPAGVLQVNAQVPADAPSGSRVPVVLTVGAQSSPTVYLRVR